MALGSTLALVHLAWVIIVASGGAKAVLDFSMALHGINSPYVLPPFSLGVAVMLIIVAFVVGYVLGWVFSTVYNSIKK